MGPAITIFNGDTTFNTDTVNIRGDLRIADPPEAAFVRPITVSGQSGNRDTTVTLVFNTNSPVVTIASSAGSGPDRVVVKDMTITGGAGATGDGIQFDNELARNDVTFTNLEIHTNDSAGVRVGSQNAIDANKHLNFTITNSTIRDNGTDEKTDGGIVLGNASNATIGGDPSTEGNMIRNNIGDGVVVQRRDPKAAPNINNAILGNSIFNNSALGIDLEGGIKGGIMVDLSNGVTLNDKDFTTPDNSDVDTGPNNLQNTPEIMYAFIEIHDPSDPGDDELHIIYHVPSGKTNSAYDLTVEFFLADYLNSVKLIGSDGREGATFIASDTYEDIQALTSKMVSFNISSLPMGVQAVLNSAGVRNFSDPVRIVATATDANGNTSEFSRAGVINAKPGIESSRPMTATLVGNVSATASTIQVDATGLSELKRLSQNKRAFKIQIQNEELLVTGMFGNSLNVLRGLSETKPVFHPAGTGVVALIDLSFLSDPELQKPENADLLAGVLARNEVPRSELQFLGLPFDQLAMTGFVFTPGPDDPLAEEKPDLIINWSTAGDGLQSGLPEAWFDDEFGIYRVADQNGTVNGVAPSSNSGYASQALSSPAGDAQIIRNRASNSIGMIRLAGSINATQMSFVVENVPVLPTTPFDIIIDAEQMKVTNVAGNFWTVS
ncbi:MAG: right-handed parallel beta-helix repeat-containing protein, partial [Planctomycetes bacterium]|nr:right-handed parallel beta-helix repeat-containing protein [Planctomycetota bacterium]